MRRKHSLGSLGRIVQWVGRALEPSSGLYGTGRTKGLQKRLLDQLSQAQTYMLSEELCELPLPWMIYANPKHRGPWQTPSPSAAKIRTDHNSGKQWETSKRTCLLAQTYLAFPPPSTTNPLWENQISSSSCQLITGPLTSTLHQVLDDLILGHSLCRNRGNGDFPVKTFFLLDSQY